MRQGEQVCGFGGFCKGNLGPATKIPAGNSAAWEGGSDAGVVNGGSQMRQISGNA